MNILLPSSDEEICERVFHLIQNEVKRIENKLSYFLPHSDLSYINNHAAIKPIEIDEEMISIFRTCEQYKQLTFGAFDITMRSFIESIKSEPGTDKAKIETPNRHYLLDQNKIRFINEFTKIDLGAFGKGYALEKIHNLLVRSKIENAFMSFGESSILVKGKHPKGDCWKVGINDLLNSGKSIYTFNLVDSSVSTSSNYYLDDSGQIIKKQHIMNPFTETWFNGICSMSVASKSPVQTEILSTAFLVMDDEQIRKAINNFANVKAIRISYDKLQEVIEFSSEENI